MDWFHLLVVQETLKSLLQHHSSKASIRWHSAFFRVQLSHSYMTTGKTTALTIWTFVSKVMSLFFNTMSRLVIAFLPRSKYLFSLHSTYYKLNLSPTYFFVPYLDSKEIKPVNPKGNQPWIFIGRTDAEAETPILWPPLVKSWLIGKDSDAGSDWGQEEKGMTEDEMAGWHHWLDTHEFGCCLLYTSDAADDMAGV